MSRTTNTQRTAKTARPSVEDAKAKANTRHATSQAEFDEVDAEAFEFVHAFADELNAPWDARRVLSLIVGLLTASGLIYLVSQFVTAILIATIMVSGSAVLGWLFAIFAAIKGVVSSLRFGTKVYRWLNTPVEDNAASAARSVFGSFARRFAS